MFILSLALIFIGCLLAYYGFWFLFLTISNILLRGGFTPLVLIISSLLFSVGVTLLLKGVFLL